MMMESGGAHIYNGSSKDAIKLFMSPRVEQTTEPLLRTKLLGV